MIASVDKLKAYCELGDMVPKGLAELVGRGQERTMCWYSTMSQTLSGQRARMRRQYDR